jgi:catalase
MAPGHVGKNCNRKEPVMSSTQRFTNATGAPVADNTNIMAAGPRGPAQLQDIWLIEKMGISITR